MVKIRQLNESEIIPAICENIKIIRVNLDKMIACDLADKSVNTIRKDFSRADYIYFTVEEE